MKKEFLSTSMPKLIMVVVLIVGTVFGLMGYFGIMEKNNKAEKEKIVEESIIKKEIKCPEDWEKYKHDVIGIKFCYPKEWGEPTTSPIKNLTRLSNMEEEFETQNIYYRNRIAIVFEKNRQVSMGLFNDQYGGEYYPNTYAHAYGYVDNIPLLKSTGDICEYKIDFNKDYESKLNEIYNDCSESIKTTIIEHYQYFDFIDDNNKSRYSYELKGCAYKKLSNSHFDNLLLSARFGYISQNEEQFTTIDQILFSLEKSEDQFQKEKDEFASFVESIETYQTIPKTFQEFEAIQEENSQITIIRKYYWLLANDKLNEAYKMRSDETELAYETFRGWYKDIYHAEPYDFKKMNSNEYEFYVEYQDHNKSKKKFKVAMAVNENKIKTLFSDEILTEEVSFGEYSAYAIKRGDKNYMILAENGKEIIIDEGDANYDSEHSNLGTVKSFYKPRFSPKGNYLIYTACGWEWCGNYVYDIKNKKIVKGHDGPDKFDFTPDEKYFYTCSSMGMTTGISGEVYSVPDFDIEFNALDNVKDYNYNCLGVDCEYDEDSKSIIFILSDEKGDERETKSFSVTDTVN